MVPRVIEHTSAPESGSHDREDGSMQGGIRSACKAGWIAGCALVLLAGCSGDITGELSRNVQVRDRVMSAIAADSALAGEMARRLVGNDHHRISVIETMLADDRSAQYVLTRIGHNPDAVDYVIQAAAADSAGRAHLAAKFKNMTAAKHGAK